MGSKSASTDQTKNETKTTVIDRKAIQEQGVQVLDSLVVSNDDKVIKESLAGMKVNLETLLAGNSVSTGQLYSMVETLLSYVNKNQVSVSSFALSVLEGARKDLSALRDSGDFVLKIADGLSSKAMTMAEQVARDQASAQRQALEIVAETKTGDYADTLKTMSAMVMGFALLALMIVKGNR